MTELDILQAKYEALLNEYEILKVQLEDVRNDRAALQIENARLLGETFGYRSCLEFMGACNK